MTDRVALAGAGKGTMHALRLQGGNSTHFGCGEITVKVQIDSGRCQGHGRCYDLAPGLFGDDDEGYGTVLGDGTVPAGGEHVARLAALNCPEHAVEFLERS